MMAKIIWFPLSNVRADSLEKNSDAGKDWRQEKGMAEDEMVEWYHWLNGHEIEQTLGDSEGQESLVCCSPWGCKESDMTEKLNKEQQCIIHKFLFDLWFSKCWKMSLCKSKYPTITIILTNNLGNKINIKH